MAGSGLRWMVRRRMRRFAACGIAVTTVDLAVLVALRQGGGWPVVGADALAIVAAASTSFLLNRVVTFGDDPTRRWTREPLTFAVVSTTAALVDIVTLRTVMEVLGRLDSLRTLLLAKAVSLPLAALVRLVGYRRTLFRRVRRRQAERRPAAEETARRPGVPRLTVVVPAYKERGRIAGTVARLRSELGPEVPGADLEIVVVDDGSADGTAEEAEEAGADRVVIQPQNRGKGAAVRAGVLAARGATVAFTDADLSYAPPQLLLLLAEVEAGWDVVVGSRHHVDSQTLIKTGRLRELTSRVFNVLTSLVLLGQYRDTQCGLKAFRADAARRLFSVARLDGFAFDVEILHLAERYHLSLAEVPVEVENSQTSTVRVGIDAARMVRDLLRVRRWAGQGAYDPPEADATGGSAASSEGKGSKAPL